MSAIKKCRDQLLDMYRAVVAVTTTQLQEMPTQSAVVGLADATFLVDSTGAPITSANPLPTAAGTGTGADQVQGTAADGAAAVGNPVQIGGKDGSNNIQAVLTDTAGRVAVIGAAADGAAVAGNPVLMAGQDGTNAQSVLTDTSGRLMNVGAAAAGAAVTGNPVLMAGQDGTNARTLLTDTSGRLVPQPQGYGAATSFTRPNDTNAYTAGDVLGASTTTSSALSFTLAGAAGGDVLITSASLEIDITAIPSGMTTFTLYLYSVTPPSALVDNTAWDLPAGDRASFLGYVSLGAPVDLGSTLYVLTNGANIQVSAASANIFGYLVTTAGYTPTAQAVYKVTLHSVAL